MGTPVRVTSIDPGMVETEFSQVRFRGDEAKAAKVYENIISLSADDIADAILWAATRPAHVNIHTILLTSIDQGNAYVLNRKS
jgi:NADP-dependent 3-hydroxy acid dehydrogenase YdfG